MKPFFLYLQLQLKLYRKLLPKIGLTMLISILLLGGIALLFQTMNPVGTNTIRIGIVAQEEEPYLDWIINIIKQGKSAKYTCELTRSEEKDANRKLQSGELTAVFVIPENYIHSLIEGDTKPVIIRFGRGQSDITSFLVQLLSDSAANVMLHTQAGIYAMNDYYIRKHLSGMQTSEAFLNLNYLQQVLTREKLFTLEEADGISTLRSGNHYFAVIFVLFFLCMGMCMGKRLLPETKTLQAKLSAIHLSKTAQVLARLCALFVVYFLLYVLLACTATFVFMRYRSPLDTTSGYTVTQWLRLWICILPVLLLICSMLQCIFVWADDMVSGLVFLFFATLFGGYLSGYFYPLSFFPETLLRLSPYLPTNCLYQYLAACLSGRAIAPVLGRLLAYSTAFVCLSLMGIHTRNNGQYVLRAVRMFQKPHTRICRNEGLK